MRHTIVVCILLSLTSPLHAQSDATVPDPDPEIERKSLQLAEGFEINLFAADPLLAKPIQMNFDPAGRLWVACSEVYPQIKPGQKANDKIIILEDTRGVGRADKTIVFADGLLIPTGVEPGDGGAYVANSTDLLHFADTDGDGKADKQRVMLSGFGTEDTHHIIHTLRWGHDGMLYFNQSVYIHSHIETPYGVRRLNGGGIWQFRPETMQLEVFLRGLWNPWGHQFDRWGQSFVTDGAGSEGINYGMPGAWYVSAVGATRLLEGLNPGSPKYCSHEILSGRHVPDDWRGNIITNDFRGHRVCRFVLREDGAGYAAIEKAELIKTNHPAFRPVDVKMGPDGAIYIADWYNPIIQHGEVDFRDPRRDHTHGRIWRVTAKGRPLVKRPKLVGAPTESLLESLKAPESWTRQQAKRVLKERGLKVLPALDKWSRRLKARDAEYEHHLLEALWTYQSLDVAEPTLLKTVLRAKDHHARSAATRVVQYWHSRLDNALDLLTVQAGDEHPQVRLEAVRALGGIHDPHAVEVATRVLDRPMDKFLDYGLWLTVRELEPHWMTAFQNGQMNFEGSVAHMVFALQATGSPAAVRPLMSLFQAGKIRADQEESVLALIGSLGGPKELAAVFDRVWEQEKSSAERSAQLLSVLEQAARQRGIRPEGNLGRVERLLNGKNENLQAVAARLTGVWKIEPLTPKLLELARAETTPDAVRQAALEGLVSLGGPASRDALVGLAEKGNAQKVRRPAVIALASIDLESAARQAVDLLAIESKGDPSEIFSAFLQRKSGDAVLAKALAGKKLPGDVAKVGVRTVRISGRDVPQLIEALTKAGNLTAINRILSPKEMQQMVATVLQQGDPVRGEAIFRRRDMTCLKCHAIAGAGGLVGPDLTSIGASAQVDYLIEAILLPNKAIKENYHSLVVATQDGRFLTGIKVRENQKELVLRDAEDREIVIPVKDIEDKKEGPSLMPEGLADSLTRSELVDVVRFLSEVGKVGPYAVSKARLVRRWQVLEATPKAHYLLIATRIASAAGNDPALTWTPAYSMVSGTLPLDAVPAFQIGKGTTGFVRCQIEVSTPGKIQLLLNSATGVTLWLDGEPVDAKEKMVLDLTTGLHQLTSAVDLSRRREGLRCELKDQPGSAAQGKVIAGK